MTVRGAGCRDSKMAEHGQVDRKTSDMVNATSPDSRLVADGSLRLWLFETLTIVYWGNIKVISGLYRDNWKENGNYYNGLCRV